MRAPPPSDHRRATGYTLVEMVLALGIGSMVLILMGSAVLIAAQSLPRKNDPLVAGVQGVQAVDQVALELESAVYVRSLTPTQVEFTVADRDGDGLPERIAYAWSGVRGEPLIRRYNNAIPETLVTAVSSFNLVPQVQYADETVPGSPTEDTTETLLADLTATSSLGTITMGNNSASNMGQYLQPVCGPDVVGWRPTRLVFRASADKTPGGFRVQMRPALASLRTPDTPILAEQSFDSTTLTASIAPYTVNLPAMPRFSTGDGLAATFMWASGSGPGKFERVGGPLGLLETSNTNSDWKLDTSKALTLQLYGVVMRAGGSSTVATRYLMSVGISLVAGSEKSPTAQTSVAVLNHPELLSGIWELSPGRNPSKTDVDGDGVPDWQLASGQPFDPATLIGEQWVTSSDTLTSTAISDFNQITVVDLRIQSLAAGATATFAIDAARSGDRCVPIQVALQRQTDGTQTLTVRQKFNDTGYQQLLSYSGLPAEPVDVKLVIEPVAPTMGVTLNGVPRGAIPLTFATVSTTSKSVRIGGTGGSVGFNYARVRLLQVSP